MLRTGQAELMKIHVFCQDLKGYPMQILEVLSLYCGEAGMRIERCRKDCYDLSNLSKLSIANVQNILIRDALEGILLSHHVNTTSNAPTVSHCLLTSGQLFPCTQ